MRKDVRIYKLKVQTEKPEKEDLKLWERCKAEAKFRAKQMYTTIYNHKDHFGQEIILEYYTKLFSKIKKGEQTKNDNRKYTDKPDAQIIEMSQTRNEVHAVVEIDERDNPDEIGQNAEERWRHVIDKRKYLETPFTGRGRKKEIEKIKKRMEKRYVEDIQTKLKGHRFRLSTIKADFNDWWQENFMLTMEEFRAKFNLMLEEKDL